MSRLQIYLRTIIKKSRYSCVSSSLSRRSSLMITKDDRPGWVEEKKGEEERVSWTWERQRFDNFSPMTSGDEKLAWNPLFAPSGSNLFPIYRPSPFLSVVSPTTTPLFTRTSPPLDCLNLCQGPDKMATLRWLSRNLRARLLQETAFWSS